MDVFEGLQESPSPIAKGRRGVGGLQDVTLRNSMLFRGSNRYMATSIRASRPSTPKVLT